MKKRKHFIFFSFVCSKGNSFLNSLSQPIEMQMFVSCFVWMWCICVCLCMAVPVHGSNDLIKRSLNGKNVVFLSFIECRRRFDVEWLIFSIQNPSNDVVLKCLLFASLCFIILVFCSFISFAQILIVF